MKMSEQIKQLREHINERIVEPYNLNLGKLREDFLAIGVTMVGLEERIEKMEERLERLERVIFIPTTPVSEMTEEMKVGGTE